MIHNQKSIVILALILISSNLFAQDLPDSIRLAIQDKAPRHQVEYLSDLCWKNRESNRELALQLGITALDLAIEKEYFEHVAQLGNYVGVIYLHYFFDHKSAVPVLRTALEHGFMIKDSTQIAYAYNNLGDAYYLNGNSPIALEYGELSLSYFSALHDTTGIAYCMVNLGLAYRLDKQYEKALAYFESAYDHAKSIKDKNRMAYCIQEIAQTNFELGYLNVAKDLFIKSFGLNMETMNHTYSAYCQTGLGDVYYDMKVYDSAQLCYEFSQALLIDKNNNMAEVSNLLGLACIKATTNEVAQGEALLENALHLAANLQVSSKILECYTRTTEFYHLIGDYKKASEYFSLFMRLSDSVFQKQQFDILHETQERFMIKQDYLNTENELRIARQEEFFLVVVLVFFGFITVVLFWLYRNHVRLNRKLAKSNWDKDRLFSLLSHDLRKPFIAIMQFVELAKEEDISQEKRRLFLENLETMTTSTYSLLENLLNLSALKTGKIPFNPQIFSIEDMLSNLLIVMKSDIDQKGLIVSSNLQVTNLKGDPNMIEIVMHNIISNAIKYSHEGGEILLNTDNKDSVNRIMVTDFGVGMDRSKVNELMQAEFISSVPGTYGEKGTGIGLGLCKEFVEKHGGHIEVLSTPGEGSEFIIHLP